MIKSYCYDIEVFPNLFSVTFVDLQDYLNVFKDCVDDKGNPLALPECLTVKEIKERLDKVKTNVFYISDTDDSQLVELAGFINNMEAKFENNVPIRYDLYGFNCQGYDDLMIRKFLMNFFHSTTKELIRDLYAFSKKIINLQKDKSAFYEDKEIEFVRSYKLPYATVDLQKVYALHAATVNVDKDTGERVKFGKSLKQTSINLKWHELLDFTLPPIDDEEKQLYWDKLPNYQGCSVEELNQLITEDFDRYVLPKYIEPMLYYNKNDVFLCCEIVRQKPDEVKLRYSLSNAFKLNLLCCSRANIADKLLVKYYSEMSGLHKSKFEKLRTDRTALSFKKIIFPHIQFKTPQLQALLEDMKKVVIYHTNKDAFCRTFDFYGTTYTLATGGIHTKDIPSIYKSDDKYVYRHHD